MWWAHSVHNAVAKSQFQNWSWLLFVEEALNCATPSDGMVALSMCNCEEVW